MTTDNKSASQGSFTGRRFGRKARKSVMFTDTLARRLITASGIGSIVAVSLVGLFLVWVVLPLFTSTGLEETSSPVRASAGAGESAMVHQAMDDYGSLAWSLHTDGTVTLREVEGGAVLEQRDLRPGSEVTALKVSGHDGRTFLGFADGSIQSLKIGFEVSYLEDEDLSGSLSELAVGQRAPHGEGLIERTPENQLRLSRLAVETDEPVQVGDAPIVLIDGSERSGGMIVAALDAGGTLHDRRLSWRKNLLTGEVRVRASGSDHRLEALRTTGGEPTALILNDGGDRILLAEADGTTAVIERDGDGEFKAAGTIDLVPEEGAQLTALAFIAGRVSLAVGDDQGGLSVWFPVRESPTSRPVMKRVHELGERDGIVTTVASSGR